MVSARRWRPCSAVAVQVGGISVQELNGLELDMLTRLDFRLFVNWDNIKHTLKQLQASNTPRSQAP